MNNISQEYLKEFSQNEILNGFVLWIDPGYSFIIGMGKFIYVQILLKFESFIKSRYDLLNTSTEIICNIGVQTQKRYLMDMRKGQTFEMDSDNISIDIRIVENGNIVWNNGYVKNDFSALDSWVAFSKIIKIT